LAVKNIICQVKSVKKGKNAFNKALTPNNNHAKSIKNTLYTNKKKENKF